MALKCTFFVLQHFHNSLIEWLHYLNASVFQVKKHAHIESEMITRGDDFKSNSFFISKESRLRHWFLKKKKVLYQTAGGNET